MEVIVVMLLLFFVPRLIRALTNKNSQGTSRAQQMTDEQKHKREAYEALQQELRRRKEQGQEHPSQQREEAPYRRVADPYEDTPPHRRVAVDPYEDTPPHRRVASPAPAQRQVVRETPSGQTYTASVRPASNARREVIAPQAEPVSGSSLSQAYRDLEMCEHETLSGVPYQAYDTVRPQVAPSIQMPESSAPLEALRPDLHIGQRQLIQGLVMAEILGPPRAKKRNIR